MKIELLSITENAEELIENAGRTAYKTFDKRREGSATKFIRMLITNGHLSVLEHAYASFRIKGASRAFTHQLVRHRLCSFTQQSQRYVNEKDFTYVEPESIRSEEKAHSLFSDFMQRAREAYVELKEMGIKNEDARFVLPNAVESEIVVTANLREWRYIIELRGNASAQWEIREMAIKISELLKERVPSIFGDYNVDEKKQVIRRSSA